MIGIDRAVLQDIANVSGFGKAGALLRQMGHCDEFAGTGEPREFRVRFTAEISCTIDGWVTVKARSGAEARELAETAAQERRVNWDEVGEPDFWDIVEVEDHGGRNEGEAS